VVPRSLSITSFAQKPYLFVALGLCAYNKLYFWAILIHQKGDGKLLSFELQENRSLHHRKLVAHGTRSTTLNTFMTNGKNFIFAASDRPAIIYASSNDKVTYSNVNLKVSKFVNAANSGYSCWFLYAGY
jgi:hypothetical protein